MPIVLPASRPVLALALLAAVRAERAVRTRPVAQCAREAGHTLALAAHVVALAAVLARAAQRARRSVGALRTRMLARLADVAGLADVLAADVVARRVRVRWPGGWSAFLTAAQAKGAGRTGGGAVRSGPAARAQTATGGRIAGRVVQAAALELARLAVAAGWALAVAVDTCAGKGRE